MTTCIRLFLIVLTVAIAAVAFTTASAEGAESPYPIGFYCTPYTQPFTEDGFYEPSTSTAGTCTFYTADVPRDTGVRFGALFRGTIGSSTEVTSHSLGVADESVEQHRGRIETSPQGEQYFAAIWQDRAFWFTTDTTDFVNYFTTGANPPPHNNYGFVQWYWGTSTPTTTPPCTENCFSNVAFIPGIQATELFEGEERRWLPRFFHFDAKQLEMTPGGESINEIVVGDPLRRAYQRLEVYGQFFDNLDELKSSDAIYEWKSLPYDWRYDVNDVVNNSQSLRDGLLLNLANEIRALAATSKTGKVSIVAHSNGGLVAKALIDVLGTDAVLVDRLIMVGSPQLGTPSAIAAMLNGHEQGLPKDYAQFIMSRSTARTLAENMPGAYGLLPLGQYSSVVADPTVRFDDSALTESFRNAYGSEIDTSAELQSFLLGIDDGRAKPAPEDILTPNVLNGAMLADTLVTRASQEAWLAPDGMEVIQIVGWGLDTMKGVQYYQRCQGGCFLDAEPITTIEGDETVVWASAGGLTATSTYYLNLRDFNEDNDTNWSHVNLLAASSTKDLINDIITQTNREAPYIQLTKPVPEDENDRLRLSVHSPVTIGVRDSQGRFTGVVPNPDPTSDIPVVVREIPNSYYFEFGEGKYIGFDADEQYEVIMQGTDDGTFTLEIEEVQGDTVTATTTYSNIPVSTTTTAELRIQDIANKSALEIDEDNDGIVDEVVEPDSPQQTPHEQLEVFRAAVTALDIHKNIKKHLIARSFAVEKAIEQSKKNSIKRAKTILAQMEKYIRTRIDKKRGILPVDAQVLIGLLREVEQGL